MDAGASAVGIESDHSRLLTVERAVLLRPGGAARSPIERRAWTSVPPAWPTPYASVAEEGLRLIARELLPSHYAPSGPGAARCSSVGPAEGVASLLAPSAWAAMRLSPCSISARPAIWSRRRPTCSRICARWTSPASPASRWRRSRHRGLGEAIRDRLNLRRRAALNFRFISIVLPRGRPQTVDRRKRSHRPAIPALRRSLSWGLPRHDPLVAAGMTSRIG